MKKLKLLIITLFIFLIGISNVNAMMLKPTGASSGKRESEITLYVTLNRTAEEESVSAVDGKFSFDSNVFTLESVESQMDNKWTELADLSVNGNFSYANLSLNSPITSTTKNIVKVVLKIKDNAPYGNTTISVSNPSATSGVDGISISGGSHTVKVLSDVNTLTGISVSGGSLTFDENTTTYNMEIDSDSTTITATKKDSTSTISGDTGNKSLNYGKNVFKITVTSESGVSKVYTLNITRPDHRSKTNTLDSLSVSDGKINFKKDILKYDITVENKITSIKVDAKLTDSKSSFVSGYGPRSVVLKEGSNPILIKVKAENEEVKTYTINVTRKSDGTKSDNNYLSELSLSEGKLVFDKEELEYKVSVLYSVEEIAFKVKAEDSKAKYEIDGETKLVVGENKFVITVTAESGATREYIVIVDRKGEDEEVSSNTKLKSLTVSGYQLNFDSDVYDYNLKISDETTLVIEYETEDDNSSVTIDGNNDLQNGSIIKVTVTAEDGSTDIYKINIEKEESSNLLIFIIIGVSVLLILVLIIVIVSKKKKNTNNKNNTSESNNVNNMNDLAVKQNVMNSNVSGNMQNIQNITYTQNSQSMQNAGNGQNNNFF